MYGVAKVALDRERLAPKRRIMVLFLNLTNREAQNEALVEQLENSACLIARFIDGPSAAIGNAHRRVTNQHAHGMIGFTE